mmetsp:Transcript_12011/g.26876  ORF Transcript_12011/g.26876 Transcript_12011/m.26876 type:complete len:535 (+) Transcript_12011:184-1788(+)
MTLMELSSSDALSQLITSKPAACVTFSAHWCGPCKASKPQLESLAQEYATKMPMGIVYESDLGDDIHNYQVRAFPTYVLFVQGKESKRVEGVNLAAVKEMMDAVGPTWEQTQGSTLGGDGGTASVALSPEQARLQRLAKLGGGGNAAATADTKPDAAMPDADTADTKPDDAAMPDAAEDAKPEPMETDEQQQQQPKDNEASMNTENAIKAEEAAEAELAKAEENQATDPTANLDPEAIKTLTESMGFTKLRAQKGLLFGTGGVEGAVEWLMSHQDDEDIDEPIKMVKPLTPEEKAAKILELKALLKAKRAEREEAEKVDNVDREKQRRFMGQEMAKTREQMEIEQRKREAQQRKREKEAFKKERARLRAELAKDKAERQANKGKLSTKLGVDGYNPDGVQYDIDDDGEGGGDNDDKPKQVKKQKFDAAKIDEYIAKVSGYRAGGDGGKCLKVLLVYVRNAADNPNEPKFKQINMDNKGFKTKVKPFIGAKQLLLAVGFQQPEGQPTTLVLAEPVDYELLSATKAKLEAALVAYG